MPSLNVPATQNDRSSTQSSFTLRPAALPCYPDDVNQKMVDEYRKWSVKAR